MNNTNNLPNIANLRREYTLEKLHRRDLPDNPLVLFKQWLQQACIAKVPEPNAMIIATVDNIGQPYQRTVLLKHYDEQGMVFFTNLSSRKALQLGQNPLISIHFPWYSLERQVMILGKTEKLSSLEVLKYFHRRPRESQIAAWASRQSCKISTRSILETKFLEVKQKFKHREIPLPKFWGGFRIRCHTIEFWQGGQYRLHDRFIYNRKNNENIWIINRLAP